MTVPVGRTLVSLSNGDLGIINNATGALTGIDANTVVLNDIAGDGAEVLFGVSGSELYEIDVEGRTAALVGDVGTTALINALGFDNAGQLYGAGGSGFYSIDKTTGVASLVATLPAFTSSGDIVFDEANNWFWSTADNGETDTLYRITLDGTFTEVGDIGFEEVYGITVDGLGTLVGYTSAGEQLEIDRATGAGTVMASVSPIPAEIFGATEYVEPGAPLSDFIGSELRLEIFSPNIESPLIEPVFATVGDGSRR
ncbi:MAG: hypothetical protein ACFB5Z_09445 [Elainellaceae cyanobacterium]